MLRMRFQGGSISHWRGDNEEDDERFTSGRLLTPRTLHCLVIIALIVVSFFLPSTLTSQMTKLTSYRQVQQIDMATFCSRRYANNTIDLGDARYFIAMNLHNNEEVVAYIIPQLQRLIDATRSDRIFVSVYESGSVDNSAQWLRIYRQFLEVSGVPHAILSDDRARGREHHRIDFLSTVRNKVMAPLYSGQVVSDYVVFINDVYFCAEDVARLSGRVQLGDDVSMACGLDVIASENTEMIFYDIWVTRDMGGSRIGSYHPFFNRLEDIDRLKAGLPIPVYSCWNGLTVVDAAVFDTVRFRSAPADACLSSECTLFCQDVWDMAPGNILVDPAVIVVYEKYAAARLLQFPMCGIGETDVPVSGTFPRHESRPMSYDCYPMIGFDSESSGRRAVPEPAVHVPNSWHHNQALNFADQLLTYH